MNIKNSILALGIIVLASCGNGNLPAESPQERIDSMVIVKVALLRSQMQKKNDSIISILAHKEADSIVKATHDETIQNASLPKPVNNRPAINRPDTLKKPVIK